MRTVPRPARLTTSLALVILVLLALTVRFYRIEAQSFWNDEGTSVALALRDLQAITRGAANDIHPPLYYYLLHIWMRLFGSSELAVRSMSALLGTALIALTFAIGQMAGGKTVGWIAALLAALSPFQVYYSQEARMYILTAFLGAVSVLCCLRMLSGWMSTSYGDRSEGSTTRWPLWYAVSTILLLYTHYFAVTLVITENILFSLWWLLSRRGAPNNRQIDQTSGAIGRWIGVQLVLIAAYAPWLALSARQLTAWPAISGPPQLGAWAVDLLRTFTLGLSTPLGFSWRLLPFGVLFLLGMVSAPSHREPRNKSARMQFGTSLAHWCCVLCVSVPVALLYIVSLRRPMYNPKFLLFCTPFFAIIVAQGLLRLSWCLSVRPIVRQLALTIPTATLILAALPSLHAYYFDARYARDDYRGIARYIEASSTPRDAVLINAPGQIETFSLYYRGEAPLVPIPGQRPLDETLTRADLEQLVNGRRRIYAILWATNESDPHRFIEGWLDQNAFKATDSWYGNVRLAIYAVPQEQSSQDIQHPLQVQLGESIHLLGYSIDGDRVAPEDILQVTLFWTTSAPIQQRYKVFTHLLDARGLLIGQRDAEPGGGSRITTVWQPEEIVADNYGLPVPPGTPPGDYALEIGMYGLEDGQRLPVTNQGQPAGDHLIVQNVHVTRAPAPPSLSVLGMSEILNVRFPALTLLGSTLTKLGHEHEPDPPIRAGDVLHLTLFWRSDHSVAGDVELILQLQDGRGIAQAEYQARPTSGLYPLADWHEGEIIRDQHHLPLPAHLSSGNYRLSLQMRDAATTDILGDQVSLTRVSIVD